MHNLNFICVLTDWVGGCVRCISINIQGLSYMWLYNEIIYSRKVSKIMKSQIIIYAKIWNLSIHKFIISFQTFHLLFLIATFHLIRITLSNINLEPFLHPRCLVPVGFCWVPAGFCSVHFIVTTKKIS